MTTSHDDADDANDAPEADDRVLSDSERDVGRARPRRTPSVAAPSPTPRPATTAGVAYEVDVRKADGTEWDVDLDSSFAVVHKSIDR